MGDTVSDFRRRYRRLRLGGNPCSLDEIERFELVSGVCLPAAYKAFLLVAGRCLPPDWTGSDGTIEQLPDLQEWARELLEENGQPPLPPHAFVFAMHQGYQFDFFLADGISDDPPAMYYLEGQPLAVLRFDRLSDLVASLAGHVAEA